MDPLELENQYVEKVILKNRLTTPQNVEKAKKAATEKGKSLLMSLADLGILTQDHSKQVLKMFIAYKNKLDTKVSESSTATPGTQVRPRTTATAVPPARTDDGGATDDGGFEILTPSSKPAPTPVLGSGDFSHLHDFLKLARDKGASDLHICVDKEPVLRLHGRLTTLDQPPVSAEKSEHLLTAILSPAQKNALKKDKSLDFCYHAEGLGRYRSCICKQRLGYDGAFRVINDKIPTFEELGLPLPLKRLTEYHQGMVLVTGPNGCGKSTTLAAMVELINEAREEHIITIEDPVEYIYEPKRSQVNQRELGSCTESFSNALRAALREDPDVIMIGEMRDLETISLAITAAETGHLVFGTLHTISAARTIDRILDVFPPEEQGQIRSMISESIKGIICQQLLPRRDGNGRALAMEILFNTPAAANLIRERKIFQMASVIQTGRRQGMISMDDSLQKLVDEGAISGVEAYHAADNKEIFKRYVSR
jgi:twitching motility protein PilT